MGVNNCLSPVEDQQSCRFSIHRKNNIPLFYTQTTICETFLRITAQKLLEINYMNPETDMN